jgi:hypothetical protein
LERYGVNTSTGWNLFHCFIFLLAVPVISDADVETTTNDLINGADKATKAYSVKRGNWVIAPIPVANETIGTGLQVVALYLHAPKQGAEDNLNATTGVAGMYTNNDSRVAGVFHQNAFYDDKVRVTGALGTGDFELKYFGIGEDSFFNDNPIRYSADADIIYLETQIRIPGSDSWYIGPGVIRSVGTITYHSEDLIPNLPSIEDEIDIGAVSLILSYDNRNDNYYPTHGTSLRVSGSSYNDTLGSDYDFQMLNVSYSHYFTLTDVTSLALNTVVDSAYGEVPFFASPSLRLRGYNLGQFADDVALLLRAELKYKFHPRWGVIGFVDHGWVNSNLRDVFEGRDGGSVGLGLRWQAVAEQTMHLGIDIAFTDNDDSALIIKIGETF